MPEYRLLGARRAKDGTISDLLIDETLTAADRTEAVKMANARDNSSDPKDANAFWLQDENGALIWSLRRSDMDA